MFECRTFITVKEIGEVLGVSESKSYGIVRDLNKELADKGYMVIPGRVSRKYFEERFYGVVNETEETEMLTLMAENVYVSEVYDNAGKKITEDDGVATSFTVWVTPEEVESINTAVVYGGIQMYLKNE